MGSSNSVYFRKWGQPIQPEKCLILGNGGSTWNPSYPDPFSFIHNLEKWGVPTPPWKVTSIEKTNPKWAQPPPPPFSRLLTHPDLRFLHKESMNHPVSFQAFVAFAFVLALVLSLALLRFWRIGESQKTGSFLTDSETRNEVRFLHNRLGLHRPTSQRSPRSPETLDQFQAHGKLNLLPWNKSVCRRQHSHRLRTKVTCPQGLPPISFTRQLQQHRHEIALEAHCLRVAEFVAWNRGTPS